MTWHLADGHCLDQALIYRNCAYESGDAVLTHQIGCERQPPPRR